ncbi:hypothetical protein [Salinicola aestuarinus]|uniref:hypothetical protein n=1 Tax=Salinicola aestuarinus TaxID=1949082 RepID=UPI001300A74F|nr:hypothetical protein [Salinicola aestuarinus]
MTATRSTIDTGQRLPRLTPGRHDRQLTGNRGLDKLGQIAALEAQRHRWRQVMQEGALPPE